jgi:adenylylsulfate kinase
LSFDMSHPNKNIVWHAGEVTSADRERLLCQRGCVVWFTGLSGSGKSTVARACESKLTADGHVCYVLDGDNVRHGLNSDLGFDPDGRRENIRRISEVAKLFCDAGLLTLTAFISPYREDRDAARAIIGAERFVEVHLDVPLAVCEERDPKKLYKRARAGEIAEFTGISAPYEEPESPELVIDTSKMSVDDAVENIMGYLTEKGFVII